MIKNVIVTQKPKLTKGILVEEENLSLICSLYEFSRYSVEYNVDGSIENVSFLERSGRTRIAIKPGQVLRRENEDMSPFYDFSALDLKKDADLYDFEIVDPNG